MAKTNHKPKSENIPEVEAETPLEDQPGQAVDLQASADDETETTTLVDGQVVVALPSETSEELIAKHGNKSAAIRALSKDGLTRSQIAKALGIRYQHVNNVLGQILKRPLKAEREAAKAAATATTTK